MSRERRRRSRRRKKSNRGFKRAVIVFFFVCLIAGAFLLFGKTPDFETKSVTGLQLEQEGFNIIATWDDMGCDRYYVSVDGENYHFMIPVKKNKCMVRHVALGKTYTVTVNGKFKDAYSKGTRSAILIEKLPQTIKMNTDVFDGFVEETMKLEVKARGDISFRSGDKEIAKVDREGLITCISDGHTWVRVRAESTGVYKNASTLVEINVYPKELDKPAVPIVSNISGTKASISWRPVDFATYYQVFKRNAASGKYELIQELKEGTMTAELIRDEGLYAVKPFCMFQEKLLSGPLSDPVEIVGTGRTAQSYKKVKIIRKLSKSNLTRVATVRGEKEAIVPQSLSMTKDSYIVTYVNRENTVGNLHSYSKQDGSFLGRVSANMIRHGNGATCDPNKGRIYITKTYSAAKTKSCAVFDAATKKSLGAIDLPTLANGIAYDVSNDKYYLSRLENIYICDSDFKIEKTIKKTVRFRFPQDVGAYNGVVLVGTWIGESESYIDLYRAADGAYLGSISVPIGEVESCLVDDGYLVILVNELHTYDDAIYRTKERITLP